MGAMNANVIHTILEDITRGDNRATIESEPGLAWYLPTLDAFASKLSPLLGHLPVEDAMAPIREELAVLDAEHDDAHRFIYRALQACEARGSKPDRAAVAETRHLLYPNGLSNIGASYHQQVASRVSFANRVTVPRVARGIAVATREVPAIPAAIADIDRALEDMDKTLSRLDDDASRAATTSRIRALFDVRRDAVSLLSNFAETAQYIFRHAEGDRATRADRLLRAWRRGIAESERADALGVPPGPLDEDAGTGDY